MVIPVVMPGIVGWKDTEMRPRSSSLKRSPSDTVGVIAEVSSHRRSSFFYRRLPVHPLKLTVLKLDGVSFEVQVARTASVRELRSAVEKVFSQPERDGPREMISWAHVWGHFCLSYRGVKLIDDKAFLKNFNVKDGDELQFQRHFSVNLIPPSKDQKSYRSDSQWRRRSWSGPELSQKFESSMKDKRRDQVLSIVIDVVTDQAASDDDGCEDEHLVLKQRSLLKLSRYLKAWFCYSFPECGRRATSAAHRSNYRP